MVCLIVPFRQNFLHCPAQVSSYFVLFFVPYICISMRNLQPNRDDCGYDGPIGHWKVANGRDGEYSLLNIEGCPSWLVERFTTFQDLSDPDRNFTKTCFGIFEINNEMHVLRIQRLLIPTNLAVWFNPFLLHQIGSSGIVVFAIIRVISTLLADPKKTKFLAGSFWKPHLGSVDPSNSFFLLRQFLDFWLMCQVLFFADVHTAKWNYPGIFGRMNLFNIYIHNGIGLVTWAPLRATMWGQCQDTKPHVFVLLRCSFFEGRERYLAVGNSDRWSFF